MGELTLHHYHEPEDGPVGHASPPACCVERFNQVSAQKRQHADWKQDEAVHTERRRTVLSALEKIETYGAAAASLLAEYEAGLVQMVISKALEAVRATGCICPRYEIETFGSPPQSVPGLDPRCGLHEEPR